MPVFEEAGVTGKHAQQGPSRGFRLVLGLVFVVAGGYIAYERIGTAANVDRIDYYEDFRGGFLALGRTDREPGVLVLSSLDEHEVEIDASIKRTALTGRSTVLSVATSRGIWRQRLRSPGAVTIDGNGLPRFEMVSWTLDDFRKLEEAISCHKPRKGRHRYCEEPFDSLADFLVGWPGEKNPGLVREFLDLHGCRRSWGR